AKAFSTGDSELENSLFQFLNTLFSDRECANRILLSDVRPIEKLAQVALPEKRGESTAIRYYPTIAGSPNAQRLLLTIYPLSYFGDWDVDHWLMNKCPNYCQLVKFNQGQKVLANIGMADSPLFDVEDFCRRYERHDNRHPVKKLLDMTKAKSDVEFLMTSGLYTRYVIKLPMELANSITNNNKKLTREIHLFLRILSANPVARIRMVNDLSFIESLSTAAESGQEARNIIGIIFNNLYDPRKGIDAELEKKWLTCDTYVKYLNANLQRLFKEGNPQYFSDTFGSSHGKVLTNSDQILESERYKIAKSILDRRAAWTRAGTAAPSIGVFGSIPTIAAIMRILATPDLTRRS
ncbi:hypothetical protein EBR96_11040, partial [bacterium]|nr:hypothetical protein [bacterium]